MKNILDTIKTNPDNSSQAIVVLADEYGTINAHLYAYEKSAATWSLFTDCKAIIGKAGFKDDRHEGDMSTPTGKYHFLFAFGLVDNPGLKIPYRVARENDYWAAGSTLDNYNVWKHYEGSNPEKDLGGYEKLWVEELYKYAAVIDFNYNTDKVLGKGSAIFFHIARKNSTGTAGCVSVSEEDILKILKWMDPDKKPCIIMGVKGHI
ncbi:L,D-transpeptidase family protein [Clostridium oryzae]|uniref:L,D-transpeptidase catalytic domain n=1 Tax=Clostridium oryzae TaxID=1450648 RepID=A0A1V4IMY0_9CLOT|nr:L,D-transpeptidase family protein [Clostridium oryzae]OPJ61408.1 L,D-transpeptidase catalytic domain [Clostridium oryzae]